MEEVTLRVIFITFKILLDLNYKIKDNKLTHSSITSPSPIIFGPDSSGGFLRASSAASASANWRFNFSKALRESYMKGITTYASNHNISN